MARWVAVVLCMVIACKKKQEAEPAPKAPSVGHSITKVGDPAEAEQASGAGSAGSASVVAVVDGGVEATIDAPPYGGNGSPAFRDGAGHPHGPGGPLFSGRGPECTDKIDHCLREGVWFSVGALAPGKLFRAVAVYELEGKWYTWIGNEENVTTAFKTKLATPSELKPGNPVIWFIEEASSPKWVLSEYDSLMSSRWEAGIIDSVRGSTFTVKGWSGAVPVETARVLVQRKGG